MRHFEPSMLGLLITTAACVLSACASQPPVPVVSRCPQFPQVPAILLEPPKAIDAQQRLEAALQNLLQTAQPTP